MCLESNCSPYPIDGERWRWRGDLERRGELELNGKKFERFMSRDYIRRIFSQSGEKRIEICKSCREGGDILTYRSVLDPFECIRTRCFVNTRLYSVYSLRVSFDDRDRYLDKDRRGEAARFYNRGCPA